MRNATNVDVRGNESFDNLNSGFAVHAASGNQLIGNTAHGNVNPRFRAANGIDVNFAIIDGADVGSSNNVFRNNLLYDNQDSGFQIYNGSHDNLVVRNISYGNGDHGFDTLKSTGTRYVSNTSYGNFLDGISIEGLSTDTTVFNNISVDNGIGREGFDLYVDDDGSIEGFASDYNLFWKSVPETVMKVNDDDAAQGRSRRPQHRGRFALLRRPGSARVRSSGLQRPGHHDHGRTRRGLSHQLQLDFFRIQLDGVSLDVRVQTRRRRLGDLHQPQESFGSGGGPAHPLGRAIDEATNTDPSPATRTWTLDTAAPNTTIMEGPADGSSTNSTNAHLEFVSTESPSTVECRLDDGVWENCSSPESVGGPWRGTHLLRASYGPSGQR